MYNHIFQNEENLLLYSLKAFYLVIKFYLFSLIQLLIQFLLLNSSDYFIERYGEFNLWLIKKTCKLQNQYNLYLMEVTYKGLI
jgi:hypothetical protein